MTEKIHLELNKSEMGLMLGWYYACKGAGWVNEYDTKVYQTIKNQLKKQGVEI